jgi:hypothetical protein
LSLALLGGALEIFEAIPETDQNECQIALLEGRTLDASFKCPALTFLRGTFGPDDEEDEGDEE